MNWEESVGCSDIDQKETVIGYVYIGEFISAYTHSQMAVPRNVDITIAY